MVKYKSEDEFAKTIVIEHFSSPSMCYDALQHRFCGGRAENIPVKPPFLFRGESYYYPTTTPGTRRALNGTESLGIKFARIDATCMFVENYEENGGDSEEGECLAQHYLSTSDGLDFSASLGVAMAFALGEHIPSSIQSAYIGVLNREAAESASRFCLRDLRLMRDALRPVRQQGFVAVHRTGNFIDLKEDICRRELDLRWFSFTVTPNDVVNNRHPAAPNLHHLYNTCEDFWAVKMTQHLTFMIDNPSPIWGDEGLSHLVETRKKLFYSKKR